MRCSRAQKYLSPYLDGELEGDERALFEEHVRECPGCARLLEQTRCLGGLFQRSERFQAPPGFSAQVMERIARQPGRLFSLRPFLVRFAETCAVTLAIALGVMSGSVLVTGMIPHQQGSAVIAGLSVESFDILPHDSLAKTYLALTEERP